MSPFEKYSLLIQPIAPKPFLSELHERENHKLQALLDELEHLETDNPGSLHWRQRKTRVTFWSYCNGKQRGITQNDTIIYALARKTYLQTILDKLRFHDYSRWTASIDELLKSFNSAGLDLKRVILTKSQYEWASSPQSQSSFKPEQRKYSTADGVLVRSKSEQFIGNILEELGIPYRYEPEMRIGNRVFHPDFVIMTVDGRKIILEHLGRMDLKNYIQDNIDRLLAYHSHDLLIGRNVFLSFESDVRSREDFMPIINQIMAA